MARGSYSSVELECKETECFCCLNRMVTPRFPHFEYDSRGYCCGTGMVLMGGFFWFMFGVTVAAVVPATGAMAALWVFVACTIVFWGWAVAEKFRKKLDIAKKIIFIAPNRARDNTPYIWLYHRHSICYFLCCFWDSITPICQTTHVRNIEAKESDNSGTPYYTPHLTYEVSKKPGKTRTMKFDGISRRSDNSDHATGFKGKLDQIIDDFERGLTIQPRNKKVEQQAERQRKAKIKKEAADKKAAEAATKGMTAQQKLMHMQQSHGNAARPASSPSPGFQNPPVQQVARPTQPVQALQAVQPMGQQVVYPGQQGGMIVQLPNGQFAQMVPMGQSVRQTEGEGAALPVSYGNVSYGMNSLANSNYPNVNQAPYNPSAPGY